MSRQQPDVRRGRRSETAFRLLLELSGLGITALPDDMRVMVTDSDAADGYPIAGFTWILLYKEQNYGNRSMEKAQAVAKVVWWMTHEGQKYAEELHYAKLSPAAVARAETLLRSLTYKGTTLLK